MSQNSNEIYFYIERLKICVQRSFEMFLNKVTYSSVT